MPFCVQPLHHLLELGHLLAVVAARAVARHRREVSQRVVAPVVAQALVQQVAFIDEVMHRQQLHRRDAQLLQILDARIMRQPRIGPAQLLRDIRIAHGKAAHMHLVDDRVRRSASPAGNRRPSRSDRSTTTLFGTKSRIIDRCTFFMSSPDWTSYGIDRALVIHFARDRLGIGIDQQLARVEAQALFRLPRTVHAIAIALSRLDAAQQPMPHKRRCLLQLHAVDLLARVVEEADVHCRGVLGVQTQSSCRGQ